ncbi:MAG: hypothetical protein ACFCUX_01905 [Candidatus Methylacidiphilales bacterium]
MKSNDRNHMFPSTILRNSLSAVLMITGMIIGSTQAQVAPEASADMEQIRRMESGLLLTRTLEEANKLTAASEWVKARARFEEVIAKTTPTGPMADIHGSAKNGLANLSIRQAQQAANTGDWPLARKFAEEAVSLRPDDKNYQAFLAQAKTKTRSVSELYPKNSVVDDALKEKVDRIKVLIYEGDSFYNTGQFSRAEFKYNEILRLDPYNQVAMKKLREVTFKKREAATARKDAFKVKAMADVAESWDVRPKYRVSTEGASGTEVVEETRVNEMYDKLESIRIPELNFTEVDVSDAIDYLQKQSKALDPDGVGVNFVLKTESTQTTAQEGADPPASNTLNTLTLDLKDMPLIKVLEFISTLTNLNYKVEEYAVFLFPSNETSDVKLIRTFSVPPTFFGTNITTQQNPTGPDGVKIAGADVKKELESKGVTFSNDTSASYLPKTAKLVVKNTLQELNLIEQLVSKESGETTQIAIEAKYIEFTEDKMKDFSANFRMSADQNIPTPFNVPIQPNGTPLQAGGGAFIPPVGAGAGGFPAFNVNDISDWGKVQAGGGTALRNAGSLPPNQLDALLQLGLNRNPAQIGFSGIMGSSGFRYLLTALESTFGKDLMSSPKLTLVNGSKSKIRIVREFRYPEEYEAPEVETITIGTGAAAFAIISVTPSTPTDFISKDIGVTLEVRANATPDRRIDLELKPEVIEFEGFIDYGGPINAQLNIFGSPTFQVATANNLRHVFSVRNIETKLQVIDGQTVVMAGFIRDDEQEVNDKVPLLGDLPWVGRAFRSKSTQSVKRNLAVFITARMVNPDGTPKFLTEDEAESFGVASQ